MWSHSYLLTTALCLEIYHQSFAGLLALKLQGNLGSFGMHGTYVTMIEEGRIDEREQLARCYHWQSTDSSNHVYMYLHDYQTKIDNGFSTTVEEFNANSMK